MLVGKAEDCFDLVECFGLGDFTRGHERVRQLIETADNLPSIILMRIDLPCLEYDIKNRTRRGGAGMVWIAEIHQMLCLAPKDIRDDPLQCKARWCVSQFCLGGRYGRIEIVCISLEDGRDLPLGDIRQ